MTKRITIQLSDHAAIALSILAKYHGRPLGTYIGHMASARAESNVVSGVVDRLLGEIAKDEGATVTEARKAIAEGVAKDDD